MKVVGKYIRSASEILKNASTNTYETSDLIEVLMQLNSAYGRLKVLVHIAENYNVYYFILPMYKKTLRSVEVIISMLKNKTNKGNIEQCKNTIAAWLEYYARFCENNG
jgi:hypothetical protein